MEFGKRRRGAAIGEAGKGEMMGAIERGFMLTGLRIVNAEPSTNCAIEVSDLGKVSREPVDMLLYANRCLKAVSSCWAGGRRFRNTITNPSQLWKYALSLRRVLGSCDEPTRSSLSFPFISSGRYTVTGT